MRGLRARELATREIEPELLVLFAYRDLQQRVGVGVYVGARAREREVFG